MTIEQVKAEAKKRFDKDLTDEQAQAWLEAHPAGELQDEELENVAGGGCGGWSDEDDQFWSQYGWRCSDRGYEPCKCGCPYFKWYHSTSKSNYHEVVGIECVKCKKRTFF